MIDPLQISMRIAASGLEAQSSRMRIVSENLANAQSTGTTPGADPYRRKTIAFENELDRMSGVTLVKPVRSAPTVRLSGSSSIRGTRPPTRQAMSSFRTSTC